MKNRKILCAILLVISFFSYAQSKQNTIKVIGESTVVVESNQGRITAEVKNVSMSADDAISQNGTMMNAVIDALESVGINGTNVQTTGFSFSPSYHWQNSHYEFEGYSVVNGLSITIDDISAVGPVIDLLVVAGVSRISDVSFYSINMESLQVKALVDATKNAYAKATILAKATGVILGKPVSIATTHSGNVVTSPLPPGVSGAVVLPSTNKISASVNIEYLIE